MYLLSCAGEFYDRLELRKAFPFLTAGNVTGIKYVVLKYTKHFYYRRLDILNTESVWVSEI
jgi:hypothetical protein